jgi:hypothetical protein
VHAVQQGGLKTHARGQKLRPNRCDGPSRRLFTIIVSREFLKCPTLDVDNLVCYGGKSN